jgi:hypothetical protein
MTSTTTTRHPVKAKSLTLLELCQTINELRHTSSRNTAQILTRRLYLHPLTISTNAKQHSSKIISSNLSEIEQVNQTIFEKRNSSLKPKQYRGLSVLSSSFPLTTRSNPKLTSSITSDHDYNTEYEASTTSISTNPVSLPSLNRRISSRSSRRSVFTRSTYIPLQPKPTFNREKKIDAWRNLSNALRRPMPKDPPTTPLEMASDFQIHDIPETHYNSIQQIQIYKRKPLSDSTIAEVDNNEDDENCL